MEYITILYQKCSIQITKTTFKKNLKLKRNSNSLAKGDKFVELKFRRKGI